MTEAPRRQRKWARLALALTTVTMTVGNAAAAEAAQEVNFIVSQRIWNATWDQALIDLVPIGVSSDGLRPQLRASLQKNVSTRNVPITAVGVRYGRFTASVSRFSNQHFEGNGIYAEPSVRRDETDVSVGYQVMPGLSMAISRKTGYVSSSQTRSMTEIAGGDTPNKGRALLLGMSASMPLNDQVALYGTLAYGPGKFIDPTGLYSDTKARYTVSEFGFAYRVGLSNPTLGLDAVSVQAGYRSQAVGYTALDAGDFASLPAEVSVSRSKARSVTDGFVLSVSLIF